MHIGNNVTIDGDEVIVIIARETALTSRDTRRAIDDAIGVRRIRTVSDEAQKSYIIMQHEGELMVYSSPLAAVTLLQRGAKR